MNLIVERWVKRINEETKEEIEVLEEKIVVNSLAEAMRVAEELKSKQDTVKIILRF